MPPGRLFTITCPAPSAIFYRQSRSQPGYVNVLLNLWQIHYKYIAIILLLTRSTLFQLIFRYASRSSALVILKFDSSPATIEIFIPDMIAGSVEPFMVRIRSGIKTELDI